MREHRRSPRRNPDVPVVVTNVITGEEIGQIGNISADGMMLIANRALVADALYQFSFALPDGRGRHLTIEIGAHEQWSERAQTPGQHWAGFRIIAITPDDLAALTHWISPEG